MPSFQVQDQEGAIVKTWICSVCGYECDGPEPPEKCPRCGVDAMYFDPVADVGDDGLRA